MRLCLDCRKRCEGTRCAECMQKRDRARWANGRAEMYGNGHRRLRREWAPKVAAGEVSCWRCEQPILPGTPWDLGHRDGLPSSPEHRTCNRAAH